MGAGRAGQGWTESGRAVGDRRQLEQVQEMHQQDVCVCGGREGGIPPDGAAQGRVVYLCTCQKPSALALDTASNTAL
jgi:hypothetical protein